MQPEHAGSGVGPLVGRARASLLSALDRELERFGLAARSVERQHQELLKALPGAIAGGLRPKL